MFKGKSSCLTIGPIYLYGRNKEEILENAKKEIQIYNGNVDAILINTYFNGVENLEEVLLYLNESKIDIPYGINYTRSLDPVEDCKESFRIAKQYGVSFVVINSIAGYSYSAKDGSFFSRLEKLRSKMPKSKKTTLSNNEEPSLEEYKEAVQSVYNEMNKMDEDKDRLMEEELANQRKESGIFVIGTIRDISFIAMPGHTIEQDFNEARKRCDAILLNSGSLQWMKFDIERARKSVGPHFPIIIDSTKLPIEKSIQLFNDFKLDEDRTISGADGMIARCLREPISQCGRLKEDKVEKLKKKVMKMREHQK